jgi:hypothetical protein
MLTIHYQGTSEPQTMRNLITELKAISEEMEWTCFVIDDADFLGIIIMVAEKCEPLSFIINKQGKLIHQGWLDHEDPNEAAFNVSIKTNFSTIDHHIAIVKLLKYIQKKYIINLSVTDEGDYFETGDKVRLEQKWNFLLQKFEEVTNHLENKLNVSDKNLLPGNLADKIEGIIKKQFFSPENLEGNL